MREFPRTGRRKCSISAEVGTRIATKQMGVFPAHEEKADEVRDETFAIQGAQIDLAVRQQSRPRSGLPPGCTVMNLLARHHCRGRLPRRSLGA